MSVWENPTSADLAWARSERIWLKHDGDRVKKAFCGGYFRTESPLNSEFHRKNQDLYNLLSSEKLILETQGYEVVFLADFNSRITPSSRFDFKNYPHTINNNGRLLMTFAESSNLFCLNPLSWNGVSEEKFTYQRHMGQAGHHASILDLGLASAPAAHWIVNFKVTDNPIYSTDSDHSTLLLSYKSSSRVAETPIKHRNIYKNIKNWNAFKNISEKRSQNKLEWFQSVSTEHQNTFLCELLKAAGRSTLPSVLPNRSCPRKRKVPSKLSTKTKRARQVLRKAINSDQPTSQIEQLELNWRRARSLQHSKESADRFKRKYMVRRLISAKGKSGSKLFWQCINQKSKGSTHIDMLDAGLGPTCEIVAKNEIIVRFFKEKFKTSDVPTPFVDEDLSEEILGVPTTKLSDTESRRIVSRITITELNLALGALNENKAEGPDDITTSMLKNTGTNTRLLILELFNDVLLSGTNPSAWKLGKVILTLKRSPEQDIENYRPITLISCLSKLLTKIIADRISAAVESSGIAGELQNGFRKGRSCSDNIFILNSILELNKSKKKKAYILFVDLQEHAGTIKYL